MVAEAIASLVEANAALRKRRALAGPERRLAAAMRSAFLAEGRAFLNEFARLKGRFPPALREAVSPADWLPLFDRAALETLQAFTLPLDAATAAGLEAGVIAALFDLDLSVAFDLAHPLAVEYVREHGAERVTRIRETTRKGLQTILTQAAEEGWSYDRTARAIRQRYRHFSRTRSLAIARYELGDAYEAGNRMVAQDLQDRGIAVQKRWLSAGDELVRPEHRANQAQGWIDLDAAFQSGHDRPPSDAGCRCTLLIRRKPDA